jgi:hypothetical protein
LVVRSTLVDDLHVRLEVSQLLGPAGLAAGQIPLGEEVLEGVMVGVDSEALAAFQVMSEDLDGVDDGEKLLLMNRIILLSRGQLARLIANRLWTLALILKQDSADANAGSISVELKGGIRSRMGNDEDGSREEGCFEAVEGVDCSLRELGGEGNGSLGEVSESGGKLCVVPDEAAVEASEAEEGADSSNVARQRPVSDGGDLLRVDTETA